MEMTINCTKMTKKGMKSQSTVCGTREVFQTTGELLNIVLFFQMHDLPMSQHLTEKLTLTGRFHLYLKLFVVMGIANVADVINLLWKDKFSDLIGILLDLPSSLQGVSIFIIFACKKKTRELFCQRLRRRDNPVPPKVV